MLGSGTGVDAEPAKATSPICNLGFGIPTPRILTTCSLTNAACMGAANVKTSFGKDEPANASTLVKKVAGPGIRVVAVNNASPEASNQKSFTATVRVDDARHSAIASDEKRPAQIEVDVACGGANGGLPDTRKVRVGCGVTTEIRHPGCVGDGEPSSVDEVAPDGLPVAVGR